MARSNIMGLHALKNQPKVNHFDQSYRNLFTAKCGELLPCYFNILSPGDSIKINASSFTRTQPLETAAFTRIRENVQFFAVPYSSMWRWFRECYKNMPSDLFGNSTSRSAQSPLFSQDLSTSLPTIGSNDLLNSLKRLMNYSTTKNYTDPDTSFLSGFSSVTDVVTTINQYVSDFGGNANRDYVYSYWNKVFGLDSMNVISGDKFVSNYFPLFACNRGTLRYQESAKLLQLLGYGDFSCFYSDNAPWDSDLSSTKPSTASNNVQLSIFPLLAYHKICQDHYIYRQWQNYRSNLCNIDFVQPDSDLDFDSYFEQNINNSFNSRYFIDHSFDALSYIDMEFSNLPLDYFNGVLPTSQYGDMTVVLGSTTTPAVSALITNSTSDLTTAPLTANYTSKTSSRKFGSLSASINATNSPTQLVVKDGTSSFGIDALRSAIQLQRYKEIQLSSDQSYSDLIEKHFGIKPNEINPEVSQYIGGYDTTLDINPEVNANLAGDNSATYGAAPTSSGSGSISYTCKNEPVIIMGIYSIIPQMEYAQSGIDRRHFMSDASDFPIPEFDSIGMQQTYNAELSLSPYDINMASYDLSKTYGYAPRYIEYKTEKDKVSGAFTSSLQHWVNPYPIDYLRNLVLWDMDSDSKLLASIPNYLFNNNPSLLSSIFVNQNFQTVDDDNFLVGMFHKVDVTRRLSKYGLPWCS